MRISGIDGLSAKWGSLLRFAACKASNNTGLQVYFVRIHSVWIETIETERFLSGNIANKDSVILLNNHDGNIIISIPEEARFSVT